MTLQRHRSDAAADRDALSTPDPGMPGTRSVSVVIPTFGRDAILVDTVSALLRQLPDNGEIIIVDQTPSHDADTANALRQWQATGRISWLRLEKPSVTRAMNRGLVAATAPIVLFVDDDIDPDPALIAQHLAAHDDGGADLVAGRVIQPWQAGRPADPASPFNAADPGQRTEFMGGNFSIRRSIALEIGGFDENFRFAAYCYEREFADRLLAAGGVIHYRPGAVIHHLQASGGGVRSFGSHLTTPGPGHSLGAYYYLLGGGRGRWIRILKRFFRAPATRFHLRRPWHIPSTLIAESRGLALAIRLRRRGPRLLTPVQAEVAEP